MVVIEQIDEESIGCYSGRNDIAKDLKQGPRKPTKSIVRLTRAKMKIHPSGQLLRCRILHHEAQDHATPRTQDKSKSKKNDFTKKVVDSEH